MPGQGWVRFLAGKSSTPCGEGSFVIATFKLQPHQSGLTEIGRIKAFSQFGEILAGNIGLAVKGGDLSGEQAGQHAITDQPPGFLFLPSCLTPVPD